VGKTDEGGETLVAVWSNRVQNVSYLSSCVVPGRPKEDVLFFKLVCHFNFLFVRSFNLCLRPRIERSTSSKINDKTNGVFITGFENPTNFHKYSFPFYNNY